MKSPRAAPAILAAVLVAASSSGFAQDAVPRSLATERGCTTCHEIANPSPRAARLPPLGPPLPEVAMRYRGDATAEEVLVDAIVRGSAGRHWNLRSGFDGMSAQGDWVNPVEARILVRWILAMEKR
jgi:cytochrome c551/c552